MRCVDLGDPRSAALQQAEAFGGFRRSEIACEAVAMRPRHTVWPLSTSGSLTPTQVRGHYTAPAHVIGGGFKSGPFVATRAERLASEG
jgi:hypothetical protein